MPGTGRRLPYAWLKSSTRRRMDGMVCCWEMMKVMILAEDADPLAEIGSLL